MAPITNPRFPYLGQIPPPPGILRRTGPTPRGTPIAIVNHSFEDPPLGPYGATTSIPGWTGAPDPDLQWGVYRAGSLSTAPPTDGVNVGFITQAGYFYQQLNATLQADTTYTLSADFFARIEDVGWPGSQLHLVSVGGGNLATASIAPGPGPDGIAPGGVRTATATFTASANSSYLGLPLAITIQSQADPDDPTIVQILVDNVRLDATPSTPGPIEPRTIYIDTAGNDAADGLSPQTAWATLAKLGAVGIRDGDTILLKGGQNHAGGLSINIGATPTIGVTISSYGDGRGTIVPADLALEHAIQIVDSSNVTIDNINIQGSGTTITGTFPRASAIWPQTAIAGLLFWGTTASTWYEDLVIRNCNIDGCYRGLFAYNQQPDATAYCRRVTLEQVHVTHCGQTGIEFTGAAYGDVHSPLRIYDGITLRQCSTQFIYGDTATTNMGTGYGIIILGDGGSCLIERCYTSDNALCSYWNVANGPTGIMIGYCDHGIIRECECHNQYEPAAVDGNGIDTDQYAVECVVERCYIANCHGEGLLVYTNSSRCVFRHCIVQNCGQNVSNDARGLAVRAQGDATFVHCSFYGEPTITRRLLIETSGLHCTYINNIFGIRNNGTFGSIGAATLIGNCYYVGSGSIFLINIGGADYLSLASMLGSGYEQIGGTPYGMVANPLWLDPGTFAPQWPTTGTPSTFTGFDLDPASPALNTALDAATLLGVDVGASDFGGNPIYSGEGTGFSFGATQRPLAIGPVPTIESVTRPTAAQGSQSITITGTDFPTPPSVTITGPNAQPITVSVISATATQITVTGVFPYVGTYHVVVNGSAPFAMDSAPPSIASVLPPLVSGWAQGQVLTIVGSGFDSSPQLTLHNPDGTSRPIGVMSSTANAILANVPFDEPGPPGTYTLTVDDSPPFDVVSVPRPVITSIDPIFHGITETQDLVIHGTGFAPGQTVEIATASEQKITVRILSVTPTAITVRGSFLNPDTYTFRVWVSDPFTLASVAKPPTITYTGPIYDDRSPAGTVGGGFGIGGFGFTASQGPDYPPIPVITFTDPNGQPVHFEFGASQDTWLALTIYPPLPPGEYTITVDGSPPWHQQSIPYTGYVPITAVDPAPQAGTYEDQYLTLTGENFPTDVPPSVIVSDPNNQSVTVTVIPPWTSTSVTIRGVFYANGFWGFRIGQSGIFEILSIPPVGPVATVLAVTRPATGTDNEQYLTIQGTLFNAHPTIHLTNPSGQDVPFTLLYGSSTAAVISGIFNQAGTWTIRIDNSAPFTVEALPEPAEITAIERPQAALDTTQTIRIDGNGFTGDPVVTVTGPQGQPIDASVVSSSATAITIELPPDLPEGVYYVSADYSQGFAVLALPIPAPTLTSATAIQSGLTATQSVTLFGTWMRDPVTVTAVGQHGTVPVTVVSSSRGQVEISGVFLYPGDYTFIVTADGRPSLPLTVTALPPAPPVITDAQPRPQAGLTSLQTLTLQTTGFLTGPLVTVLDPDGLPVPVSVVSAPSAPLGGPVTISGIFWPEGTYTITVDGSPSYPVTAIPIPRITAVEPPQAGESSPQTILITGTDFPPNATVTVTDPNGQNVPVTVNSVLGTAISITGVFYPPGSYTVRVGISAPFSVQALTPIPVVTAVVPTPQSGVEEPQTITISGRWFPVPPTVTLADDAGPIPATVLSYSETAITLSAVFVLEGIYTVQVDGSNVFPFEALAVPPPTITGVTAFQAGRPDSQDVTITGHWFPDDPVVTVTDPAGHVMDIGVYSYARTTIDIGGIFTLEGTYTFQVSDSNVWSQDALAPPPPPPPPIISNVSQPQSGWTSPQLMTISGSLFPTDPVVTVTGPNGLPVPVTVVSASATQIVVSGIFTQEGIYTVRVNDSNVFSVEALPPIPEPPPFKKFPIRRLRQFLLPASTDHRWIQIARLELELRTGTALIEAPPGWPGHEPMVMMRISRDGGKTWGPEQWRSAGKTADYLRRVRWLRQGQYRDAVIQIVVADPVDWQFVKMSGDLTEGSS